MHQGGELFWVVIMLISSRLFKKNRSVTAPSDHILLGDDDAQSFKTPGKITVSLHQVPRFCYDMIHFNVNTRT